MREPSTKKAREVAIKLNFKKKMKIIETILTSYMATKDIRIMGEEIILIISIDFSKHIQ